MPLYHSILETLQLGATYRSSQSSPLWLLGKKICRFQVPLHQTRECTYAILNAILEMMSSALWSSKGLTFAPKCLFPSRVSISLRRLLSMYSMTIEHRQSDTDITTSWAMKVCNLPCCTAVVNYLMFFTFLLGDMDTLTRQSFEPLQGAWAYMIPSSQRLWFN